MYYSVKIFYTLYCCTPPREMSVCRTPKSWFEGQPISNITVAWTPTCLARNIWGQICERGGDSDGTPQPNASCSKMRRDSRNSDRPSRLQGMEESRGERQQLMRPRHRDCGKSILSAGHFMPFHGIRRIEFLQTLLRLAALAGRVRAPVLLNDGPLCQVVGG